MYLCFILELNIHAPITENNIDKHIIPDSANINISQLEKLYKIEKVILAIRILQYTDFSLFINFKTNLYNTNHATVIKIMPIIDIIFKFVKKVIFSNCDIHNSKALKNLAERKKCNI